MIILVFFITIKAVFPVISLWKTLRSHSEFIIIEVYLIDFKAVIHCVINRKIILFSTVC